MGGEQLMTETIGQRLNRERTKRNLSLRALAEQVGVGFGYLSEIENAKRTPSDVVLTRIAEVFELDADELILVAGRVPVQYIDAMAADPVRALRYLRHVRQRVDVGETLDIGDVMSGSEDGA